MPCTKLLRIQDWICHHLCESWQTILRTWSKGTATWNEITGGGDNFFLPVDFSTPGYWECLLQACSSTQADVLTRPVHVTGPSDPAAGVGGSQEEKSMDIAQFVFIMPLQCALRLLLCAEVNKECRRNANSLFPGVFILPSPSLDAALAGIANDAIDPARLRTVPGNGNRIEVEWSATRRVRIAKTRLGIVARVANEGFCSGSLWHATFKGARRI